MTDIELRLLADVDQGMKGVSGFRKEYAQLVKAIEKPIRQIDALQKTQESAKKAAAEFFAAKRNVEQLRAAFQQAGQPVKGLASELSKAERTLARTTQAFERQKAQVREQRAELKAAGVDYRNLAAEQQRLQGALSGAIGKGAADAAITKSLDQFGVTRLRDLRAQLVALQSDYKRLTQAGVLSASERASAEVAYRARVNQTTAAIREATAASNAPGGAGLADVAGRLAGIVAAAYTVRQVAGAFFSIADEVNTLEDRMRGALPVTAEYEEAQGRLEEISKRVRIPLAQTSELFLRSVAPLREMGFSARTTADMVAVLSAGLVTSNVKGEQAVAVINQLSKGLQTGVIRGDAFNAMLENAPTLIDALTKGLGVSRSELIRMAEAGEITTERFVGALSKQSEALLGMADNMRSTVGDAQGTFTDSMAKVIGSIDALFGISAMAVKELDKLSAALDKAADGDGRAGLDALTRLGSTTGAPAIAGLSLLYQAYDKWRGDVVEAVDAVTVAEEKAREAAKAIEEQRLSEMRAYASEFDEVQKGLVNSFKTALDDQVAAQNKANSALSKAKNEQLATEKRYSEALEKLRVGATGPASYGNAQALQAGARQALASGDIDRAKKNAQAALKMLGDLAEAGENTYGFEGFIKSLQAIEAEADKQAVTKAEKARQIEIDKTREFKKEFEELKNFKITPTVDDAALAEATAKMQRWAKMIGKDITIDPRVLTQDPQRVPGSVDDQGYVLVENPPPVPTDIVIKDVVYPEGEKPVVDAELRPTVDQTDVPPVEIGTEVSAESADATTQRIMGLVEDWKRLTLIPVSLVADAAAAGADVVAGFAGGGWTGPGSKYQPAGVVHADEHVQPKRVVNEPGALPFLEQIRLHGFKNTMRQMQARMHAGMRGYAEGGLVRPDRVMPSIPQMNPALLSQGSPGRDLGRVDLNIGGESFNFLAEPDQFDRILRRTATKIGRTRRN